MENAFSGIAHWAESIFLHLGLEAAWLGVLSLLMFVASIVVVPFVIRTMPADYYCLNRPAKIRRHPLVELVLMGIKNAVGAVLVLIGIAMLVLPGQGLLTMVLGVALVDFPGKKAFERRLLKNPSISTSLNWLRRRLGQSEFRLDC